MAFADDLLEQAGHLARRERTRPRQASLRRAVSTAYYALFHLLVAEATANWKRAGQRAILARAFEHGRMRSACSIKRDELAARLKMASESRKDHAIARHLHLVTHTFARMQLRRHDADYDNLRRWTRTEVLNDIDGVAEAFQSWESIQKESLAQDFLISLLIKDR